MSTRRAGRPLIVLTAAGLALLLSAPPAVAAPGGAEPFQLTQPEVGCDGGLVDVTYDGQLRTSAVTTGSGGQGLRVRAVAEVSWQERGEHFRGRISSQLLLSPTGRTETYLFQGTAVGTGGTHVHLREVAHGTLDPDGSLRVLVEREVVDCR